MDSKLVQGTLEMLILDVLARGPSYGYQISQTVVAQSQGYFEMKEGSLYPALHRMERGKWLTAYWVDTDEGRRRKYYKLTPSGQKALKAKREEWNKFAAGVAGVLNTRYELV